MDSNLIVVLGPTASGKTRLAAKLAAKIGSEILSADSRQVYRGMDIGTGKDLEEYTVCGNPVPYHLIDIIDPAEEFNVFSYQKLFYEKFDGLIKKGIVPVAVGGTGLYIDAVIRRYQMPDVPVNPGLRQELEDMDKSGLVGRLRSLRSSLHNTTDLTDRGRLIRAIEIAEAGAGTHGHDRAVPEIKALLLGIRWDRSVLRVRIAQRLERRLADGMVDEVKRLRQAGLSWNRMESLGLEYRYVGRYLQGKISYDAMVQELKIRIGQFAKRQLSWFRRMERQGIRINWIEGDDSAAAWELVRKTLGKKIYTVSPR